MPRDPKPWYRQDRDAWFVTINGRRFDLGPDREIAQTRFHELMLTGGDDRQLAGFSVFRLFDEYLEWVQAQRAARTYEWYSDFLKQFSKFLKVDRPAEKLKPYDILRWTAKHPNWSSTYQNNAIRSVQRPYRWAHRLGLLDSNPMEYIEKPSPRRREKFLTPDEYRDIFAKITSKRFKDLISAAWETGARPQGLIHVEVRHVDLANARWVFPPNESKVKTRHRIIYLNDEAQRLTCEALSRVKSGPLFRNRVGRPWHPHAIGCQFTRLKKLIGRRLCMYMFRHSFATRMLTVGVDPMTVATLLGHSDASMLRRVYQHLAQCPDHLIAQLQRVSQPTLDILDHLGPNRVIGQYQVESLLGSGAFGVVYRARDLVLDRTVALKVLRPGNVARDRVLAEARAAAALNHPNVCTVHAIDDSHGALMIVMEYVDGETLAERIQSGALAPDAVAAIGRQIAAGLAAAHAAGVVHGDLKPANLMVTPSGTIKIMDFGLAQRVSELEPRDKTIEWTGSSSSYISGTPGYMAPEQTRGEPVSAASDVFVLGLITYELLIGKPAVTGNNILEVFTRIEQFDAADCVAGLPEPFAGILCESLVRQPTERHITMAQIAERLA